MLIREMRQGEEAKLLPLVLDLWPNAGDFEFQDDLTLVAEAAGEPVGFAMVTIRPFSNACETAPCPHLEGWYVLPDHRRKGVGRALLAACEHWARNRGFTELGSEVLIDNAVSLDAHRKLGFEPVEVVQYFRKAL